MVSDTIDGDGGGGEVALRGVAKCGCGVEVALPLIELLLSWESNCGSLSGGAELIGAKTVGSALHCR